MNHLAHALLSGSSPDRVLGGFLGDFVRGAIDPALPRGVAEGIALHRAIDSWTDAHPEVVAARARFVPPFRRYAGIFVDIWFDHLLARSFARWSTQPLEAFGESVVALLESRLHELPADLQRFTRYLRANGLPAAYADRAVIGRVFAGVGSRLVRENPIARGLDAIAPLETLLEAHFEAFFPELVAFADERLARLDDDAVAGP
ncbi:ACP phosphodiesterase [Dokdonella sp. MW10]|uniref:acyl carrier protein phosphodiesterase n=1 Tax=Dokdonella sp. MW10 TaxID=2992926 RepID=UPI003F7FDFFD